MNTPASTEELYRLFVNAGRKVCTDTRQIEPGALFFALKGPSFNGNFFVEKALREGCSAAVTDATEMAHLPGVVFVNDTLKALQQLARFHRLRLKIPVLAITGSNAKTTTKELVNAVLSKKYKCLATIGNLNNHIGVPLTLLRLTDAHELGIIEMGANHIGEISTLCDIASPTHGLITNIGKAHLEGFGGIEGVKKGKGELLQFIRKHKGIFFRNAGDPALTEPGGETNITYGTAAVNDVVARDFSGDKTVSFRYNAGFPASWEQKPLVNTRLTGSYNFINCVAAACVGMHFGVPEIEINSALENYVPELNRSQLVQTGRNTLILDAYNANPDSMQAAIDNFVRYDASKKMVLLGDMFELGEFSNAEHLRVIERLKQTGLKEVYLVGPHFGKVAEKEFRYFETTDACKSFLEKQVPEGYTVLVKGSRSMKMESLREVL